MANPVKIPKKEVEHVLYMLWLNTTSLESRVDCEEQRHSIDRMNVTAAYNVLNRLGYTDARPAWETRAKTPTLA